MALRVAVIGVRGVGKFHAQWFAHEGAQVVAFVASSPETLNANETALRQVVPDFLGAVMPMWRRCFKGNAPMPSAFVRPITCTPNMLC